MHYLVSPVGKELHQMSGTCGHGSGNWGPPMNSGKGNKGGRGGKGGKGNKGGPGSKPSDGNFYDPPPGTVLGGVYRVEQQIGTGTFSHVFDVRHITENQLYACKIMAPLQQYIQYTSVGRKEAELLKRLTAEDADGEAGMLRLKTYFTTTDPAGGEWYCLVMEKLGTSLHDFIRSNRDQGLEIQTIQSIARQLLRTVAFLHDRQLTHTDIKHKNIMLVSADHVTIKDPSRLPAQVRIWATGTQGTQYKQLRNPRVKIIDYGNVIHEDEPHPHPIHTKQFRCPEVILECGQWREKSDLWCIGCVLAFLYTGTLLFNTHDTNVHLAMMEKVLGPIPDPLLKASRKYRSICGLPIQRWLRGQGEPPDLARSRPLSEVVLPAHSPFSALLTALLTFDPDRRPTAREALAHPFYTTTFAPEVH